MIYQLYLVASYVALLDHYVSSYWMMNGAFLLLIFVHIFYFSRNAARLFNNRCSVSPDWVDIRQLSSGCHDVSVMFATDSVEISFYIYLYSGNSCLLKHYSIQNSGYKKQLEDFCLNFKIAGYELKDVQDVFSCHIEYSDWVPRRIEAAHGGYGADLAKIHTLQHMATYREYNQRVLDDDMFNKNGWTSRLMQLIAKIWHDCEARKETTVKSIADPTFDLRAAVHAFKSGTKSSNFANQHVAY